jgi:hypothetical protein
MSIRTIMICAALSLFAAALAPLPPAAGEEGCMRSPGEQWSVGDVPGWVAIGDLNSDGRPDLVVANNDSDNVSVLLNNGDGTFAAQVKYAAGYGPISVAIADLDRDGELDLAVANQPTENVSVLLNNGDGTFATQIRYSAGDGPRSVAIGDLDDDGDLDLATANLDSDDVSVLLNGCEPAGERGDLNCDGSVDFNDIDPFVAALIGQENYEQSYPDCEYTLADISQDGSVDFNDIDGFVECLVNNGCP